jgi:dTMP kinase
MADAKQTRAIAAGQRGKFITLEGVDGAGKSTHVSWIAERLRKAGREVVVSREPGGTPLAEKLRSRVLAEAMDPVAETRLMFEARADHVAKVIEPALARGAWVVCDRFTDSTVAYQGAGKGVDRTLIDELARKVHPRLRPDLTLIFDATYQVSSKRLAAAGRRLDRFESEDRAFFDRVRSAYRQLAESEPQRVRLIDGTQPADQVKADVEKYISSL